MPIEPTGSSTDSQKWIARIGDERIEADGLEEMRSLVSSGRLRPEHYVFDPTQQQWSYAREIEALAEALAQPVKPPADAWIVQIGGKNHTLTDLGMAHRWIAGGRIQRSTLIRNPVLQKWIRAGDVLELEDAFDAEAIETLHSEPVSRGDGSSRSLIIGLVIAVLLGIVTIVALSRRGGTTAPAKVVATPTATMTQTASKPRPPLRIHNFTFGSEDEKKKSDDAAKDGKKSEETATTTEASVAAIAPSTTVEQVAERPPPRPRDDAEDDLYDDDGDVVFKSNGDIRAQVSGDTRVVIDRSMHDLRYHVGGCRAAKGDMTTVSLDLARQNYSACPICKPPK